MLDFIPYSLENKVTHTRQEEILKKKIAWRYKFYYKNVQKSVHNSTWLMKNPKWKLQNILRRFW